jgi:hypothetical protein
MLDPLDVKNWSAYVQCRDGRYRPARPLPTFFKERLRDALAVLRGEALAVYFYDGHERVEDLRV